MSKKQSTREKPPTLVVQVDPMELIHHDYAFSGTTHLGKDQASFAEHVPAPKMNKPDEEFALLNLLAKIVEAMNKADPNKPEGIVLGAMAKNFVTRETAPALQTGNTPINPQKPDEFKTQQFNQAMKELHQKHKNNPPKRDAIMCVAAAAHGQPLTGTDVYEVFRNLTEDVQLTPEQWQQLMMALIEMLKLMQQDSDEFNRRMAALQGNPSPMALANLLQGDVNVNADGTVAARRAQPQPSTHKPDETNGLLEMSRDFWLALFKAAQDKKLQDERQRDLAEVLRYTGQKYVRTGRNAGMAEPTAMDAKKHRMLLQKLRSDPVLQAEPAKMAALDKLAKADATGRSPSPQELLQIFEALGQGVQLTPEMLRAILEFMIAHMKGMRKAEELGGVNNLMAGGGPISPVEAVRVMNKACVRKPEETAALLELFTKFFLAMQAANQNAALRDQHDRMVAETLEDAAKVHGGGGGSPPVDADAYRMKLMKLRADPKVKEDPAKARAVEELVAAEGTGKRLTQQQMLDIFQDLSRGVKLTPEMVRAILEYLCNQMRAVTPNEKAEMQKRFRQNPPQDPPDFVEDAARVRQEQNDLASKGQLVGCFQILPDGHPAMGHGPKTTQSKEVGMRAGPASIEWHRYQALGLQPPEEEMARIVLVQSQLADPRNFDDEKTQKTLMKEASDVSFRSILQPSVMEKYKESLRGDSVAMSALQSLSQVGTMDDRQLGKKVDHLLTTLYIDRQKLRNVLQQLVKDRLMTNDEAKDVERRCEVLMASGGGKMKLSDLQAIMKKRGGR